MKCLKSLEKEGQRNVSTWVDKDISVRPDGLAARAAMGQATGANLNKDFLLKYQHTEAHSALESV